MAHGCQVTDVDGAIGARVHKSHDRYWKNGAGNKCAVRGWVVHAVNALTNHVHIVVSANEKPQKVRDQLKANCTRRLRIQMDPLNVERTWSGGGDCEVLADEADIELAVIYVNEAQSGPR